MLRSTSPANARTVSKPYSLLAAIVISTLTLAACGGGGGGSSSPPPASPSNPPPPPAPPPPTTPTNTAPSVTAGDDQTVTLPTNSVTLNGTATDAENNALTYAWTSSPADGVTFADATAGATQATFTTAGTYTLTLTANDGTTTGTDALVVTVNAAPAPPPPPVVEASWPGVDPNNPAVDPNHGWVAAAAATDVGMDQAALDKAIQYAMSGGGGGMITRHGKLVAKWSDTLETADPLDDITIDKKVDIKSSTKSIGSIALGIAIERQLLALTDTAQSKYPNFGKDPADLTPPDPQWLSQITIQQLATHTSGYAKPSNPKVDLLSAPGTNWVYSDGGLNWLADTLTHVFQKDLNVLLNETVWGPLNITTDDVVWRLPAGDNVRPAIGAAQPREFAAGISANANAMARIGLLFLRKGMWKDQRLLPESFVTTVSTPRPETKTAALSDPAGFPSANEGYGLMWWTNATGQLATVPKDAYWAWGLGDSLIIVIPSLDIVVARVGQNPDTGVKRWRVGWNGDYKYIEPFLTPIVQSVTNPEK
jgi:CubicO group peptidase (beta-lactamase class C family)